MFAAKWLMAGNRSLCTLYILAMELAMERYNVICKIIIYYDPNP